MLGVWCSIHLPFEDRAASVSQIVIEHEAPVLIPEILTAQSNQCGPGNVHAWKKQFLTLC